MTAYHAHIAEVDDYSQEKVRSGLEQMLKSLGGMERFVRPGQKVLVKPNLIAKRFESQTNPLLTVEIANLAREYGGDVGIADSTAWNSVITNAKSSGLFALAKANDIPIYELKEPRKIKIEGYHRHLCIAGEAIDADVIINVPKLKAHQQLKLSAGIKNMFGCVPGKRKAVWHFTAGGNDRDFGLMIMQTFIFLNPKLTIIDAVDALEGPGPIGGSHRRIGALIGSENGLAAEITACELISCDPMNLITMQAAKNLNLRPLSIDEIKILGADIKKLQITDFNFPAIKPINFSLKQVVRSITKQLWLLHKERFCDSEHK